MTTRSTRRLTLSVRLSIAITLVILIQAFVMQIGTVRMIAYANDRYYSGQMDTRLRGIDNYLGETVNDLQVKANLLAGQKKVVEYTEFRLVNLLVVELSLFKTPLRIDSIAIFGSPDDLILKVGDVEAGDPTFQRNLREVFSAERHFFVSRLPLSSRLWVFSEITRDNTVLGEIGLALNIDRAFIKRLEDNTDAVVILNIGDQIVDTWGVSPELRFKAATMGRKLVSQDAYSQIAGYMAGAIPLRVFGDTDATAICLLDMSTSLKLIERQKRLSMLFTALLLVAALSANYLFYRAAFLTPFARLRREVRRIAEGDFSHSIERRSDDEIGDLAESFEQMRRSLLRRDHEVAELGSLNNLIMENVRSGVLTVDREERIMSCNPAALAIAGLGAAHRRVRRSAGGVPRFSALPPPLVIEIRSGLRHARYVTAKELRILSGGPAAIISLTTSPLASHDGSIIGLIAIVVDITRERRLEEQLERSARMAAMGEMAAGVAHQIRNPLAVMKVSAGMLQGRVNDGETDELASVIATEIENLDHVVTTMLDYTRPVSLNIAEHRLALVIADALRLVRQYQFPQCGVRVELENTELGFSVDKNLLEQIVANLVENALEAMTGGGTVTVRALVREDALWIEVQDEGPGIGAAQAKLVFTPFFTTKGKGTGLGLSIVHRLVEVLGGSIEIVSPEGGGALFRIMLRAPDAPSRKGGERETDTARR